MRQGSQEKVSVSGHPTVEGEDCHKSVSWSLKVRGALGPVGWLCVWIKVLEEIHSGKGPDLWCGRRQQQGALVYHARPFIHMLRYCVQHVASPCFALGNLWNTESTGRK